MELIILISVIIYIIGILVVYHNVPAFEKDKKFKFIAIGVAITIILTMIICAFTTSAIKGYQKELIDITRNTAILIFSPINLVLLIPYLGNSLSKYKEEKIKEDTLKKRFIITLIILVVIFIFELNYIKSFQIGLLSNFNL